MEHDNMEHDEDEAEVRTEGSKEVVVNRFKVIIEVCILPVCCITVVNVRNSRMYSRICSMK